MAQQPTPLQTLILWTLIAQGGEGPQASLGRKIAGRDRNALRDAKYLNVEKHTHGLWLTVTDRGWAWAARNLSAPLPKKAQAADLLQAWLARLQAYMEAKNVTLAEIISPSGEASYANMRDRIRSAYCAISGGVFNKAVFLRDLRGKLSDFDRVTLEQTLLQMSRTGEASLMQQDNRRQITDADRAAAILIGGEPRHILWITR